MGPATTVAKASPRHDDGRMGASPAPGSDHHHLGHRSGQDRHAGHGAHGEAFRSRFWVSLALTVPIVSWSEMSPDRAAAGWSPLAWAGITLGPAVGAVLMSASTIVVALNAQLLRRLDLRPTGPAGDDAVVPAPPPSAGAVP
jgi:hypothetical protein